ncbi:glycosyl transferase, group 1 [Renibacterium salmoninarum ATCC 33209]|uniref:Glycosyl transferase, group 1 n=1 Tax=Renibacterium salmoninarum (strain ATCC 33209 / DSM 20767 / JCM 11484 / NBRC 15589 / NCIMB 2235) TaxID=288705 RepID=A9WN77_RENSM|nr:glycosyltransferase family 4 protein [Renibacterium salmoninarum]ABY23076.1 glycosyl transferase, group 1 [Renibacterium salmoninarum ATCC 33209]
MARKPKVLVVGQHFWPEGFRINDICDFFVENDLDIEVLCGLPNYPTGEYSPGYSWRGPYRESHRGIKIYRAFEIRRGSNSNARVFLNYVSFPFFSLFHLPRLIFGRYDHVFIYQLSPVMMGIVGIFLGKIKRIPTTMYVLDLWPENLFSVLDVKRPWMRKIAEKVSHWHYRQVDRIVVLSDLMRSKLGEISHLAAENIEVIPQACEKIYEEEIHDAELAAQLGPGFKIVFAGNISPTQSFETILDAATELQLDGYTDIKWVIVGDGMSRHEVEAEVERRGLSSVFVFEGHHPIADIPKYTTLADALAGCLVKSELLEATVPAKVMSYIAAGRPLLLAMDGEVKELVTENAKCGLVGPAGDAAALAANVRVLYSMSSDERQTMGARGKKYHFEHLERNLVLGQLTDFLLK